MDEFSIIHKFFSTSSLREDVSVGVGDDCAVVMPRPGSDLVMSIDTLVEGVHFPTGTQPDRIGARAMSTALSDLAAMGAEPLWFTLALTLPEAKEEWLESFSEGLMAVANRFECSLIGGDTTKGPLTITIQVHGAVESGKALKRSGAKPGDIIYVTGNLGDGAAALSVLEKKLTVSPGVFGYLMKRFFAPSPKIHEAMILSEVASAAIDISDGLYGDLTKICDSSLVGAVVDVARLPISELWRDYVSEGVRLDWALAGGDDYQICFTVPRDNITKLDNWIKSGRLLAAPIGKITNKLEVILAKEGKPFSMNKKSYDHFGEAGE